MTMPAYRYDTLFDHTLDDLLAYREARMTQPKDTTCGACGVEFPTLDDVFSHPCKASDEMRRQVAHEDPAPLPRPAASPQPAPRQARADGDDGTPIDPEKVEAWLAGLGRKVEDHEMTARKIRAAVEWLDRKNLAGELNEFLFDMHAKAFPGRDRQGRLSARQARGVMNCWRADVLRAAPEAAGAVSEAPGAAQGPQNGNQRQGQRTNRHPGKCTNCGHEVAAGAGCLERHGERWVVWHREGECPSTDRHATDGTLVPGGRYAYEADGAMKFWRLELDGVYAQASDELHRLPNEFAAQAIVDRIAAEGVEECARRYGRELGECGRCGRTLTSEWRERGVGPVCARKVGWA